MVVQAAHGGMVKKGRHAQLVISCEWHYLTSGPELGWVRELCLSTEFFGAICTENFAKIREKGFN